MISLEWLIRVTAIWVFASILVAAYWAGLHRDTGDRCRMDWKPEDSDDDARDPA